MDNPRDPVAPRDPVSDLRRIAFLLERALEAPYRVRAFRRGAAALAALPAGEVPERLARGTLTDLPGVGEVIARCVGESLAGEVPVYLRRLEATAGDQAAAGGAGDRTTAGGAGDRTTAGGAGDHAGRLRAALRGDLHTHSEWSDGGSPIGEMAETARDLGHEYVALTDHSPRLTVARGLSAERLREQLAVVAAVNERLAPFRVLTGIEVDILPDGSLDQDEDLLAELDVVVASVHSELRMPAPEMTRRMVTAVANPHVDVLGHCTGRRVAGGRRRPPSEFDAELVFAACARFGVAVEINSRPERLDPPKRLLRLAVEAGTLFAIDSDAHAPGQLDWQPRGCVRAAACAVPAGAVVNTWPVGDLLAWTAEHERGTLRGRA